MIDKRVVIIGAGASGYFTAIRLKELNPSVDVLILEKTGKTLSKLRISGGGRCNVTHDCRGTSTLLQHYPRGKSFLKKIFHDWSVQDTIDWFETNGVPLKTESDGRMFPESDSSETVAQMLEWKAKKLGIGLRTNASVVTIVPMPKEGAYRWQLNFNTGGSEMATDVVLAMGGFSKESQYNMISTLGVDIVPPVPSLFTFNIPDTTRWMNEKAYCTTAMVSWLNLSEEEMRDLLRETVESNPKRRVDNLSIDGIPRRLWEYILKRAETPITKMAADLSKFEFNKIIENLCRMPFDTDGRTMFKEEFVTAGGIDLAQVNSKSMEIKGLAGLYATGEVLDVDGVTGGFNFQAAWSTAATAAKAIAN